MFENRARPPTLYGLKRAVRLSDAQYIMGRGKPRKFKTAAELEQAWEDFKSECDSQKVLTHDFSAKNSEFVTAELKRSVTYTVKGFCVYAKLPRADFYATYANNRQYCDTVRRMEEESEQDARKKFELGIIPSQLSGLWMSNYGYSVKQDNNITGEVFNVTVTIGEKKNG